MKKNIINLFLFFALTNSSFYLSNCQSENINSTRDNSKLSSDSKTDKSEEDDSDNISKNSIAINPNKESSEEGIKSLSNFNLPDDYEIDNVSVVKANLDGRDLDLDDISLGKDPDNNIIFFISKTAFDNYFTGEDDEELSVSVHNSETFEQKKQEVRTELLQQYQDETDDSEQEDETIPTPEFLTASVRGESLTRQMVAVLKKDAHKLAKEGVFIDRNFYVILEYNSEIFEVKKLSKQNLISKFTIYGSEVQKTANLLKENSYSNESVITMPVIAEKLSQKDNNLFRKISDISTGKKIIEIEEIEEVMELEIGPELKSAKSLSEYEFNLDIEDLNIIEKNNKNLFVDSFLDAKNDNNDELTDILKKANEKSQENISVLSKFGRPPIPPKELFDPNRRPEDPFSDFNRRPLLKDFHLRPLPKGFLPPPQDKNSNSNDTNMIPPKNVENSNNQETPLPSSKPEVPQGIPLPPQNPNMPLHHR